MQHYDSPPGGNFKIFMDEALQQANTVVCILSHTYMQSLNCKEEFSNAKDLRLIKVDDCTPVGLLASRVYINVCGLDEDAAMKKLTAEWNLPPRPKENPGFPAAVSTSTKSPEKPDFPFEQEPSTKTESEHVPQQVKPKKSTEEINVKFLGAFLLLLWVSMAVVAFCFPTLNPSDQIFDAIAWLLSVSAAFLGLLMSKKTSPALRSVGKTLFFVLIFLSALFCYIPERLWAPHWQVIAMSPSEVWSDGKAYSAYANGEFDLSLSRSIRLTFDSSQAGTKFRLRLAPSSADLNEPSGVRWEMVSIPSNGIVTLPLKPEDFRLKREDMRQLIQIAVLSGDNAWNRPTMQGADKQAVFFKIEKLTNK